MLGFVLDLEQELALPDAPNILVALDFDRLDQCNSLVDQLDPALCRLKVGKEMFTLFGPALVESLQNKGFDVFLDLKFHDIPNTVAKALKAAASLGVWMVNVHASGGQRMLEAAAEAIKSGQHQPLLIAVTVLTSMSEDELPSIGVAKPLNDQVKTLAALSYNAGLDGVVCSAHEAAAIKKQCAEGYLCVTPGIRPAFAAKGDQRRIMTPAQAIAAGSDYLVIGRPITQAEDPLKALHLIVGELKG